MSNGLRRTGRAAELSAPRRDLPLPTGASGRLKERLRARLYDLLAAEFTAHAKRSPTRKRLAAQLGQTPEDIGKWLAGAEALAGDAAGDAAGGLLIPAPAAKPARRSARAPKDAAPAADTAPAADPTPEPVAAVPAATLTTGTTIAIGATMVGPGVAALASIDVNPVAQVEVLR